MSVERSDKDKDADENVDADQVTTGRPVGSEQSIDLFTQREEINRHRLQGVWIATCSCETSRKLPCSRTREEDRESPSSTALQADLQQSNAYNPFSEKKSKMNWDLGNVELFV